MPVDGSSDRRLHRYQREEHYSFGSSIVLTDARLDRRPKQNLGRKQTESQAEPGSLSCFVAAPSGPRSRSVSAEGPGSAPEWPITNTRAREIDGNAVVDYG
jgi:hypothetical protein